MARQWILVVVAAITLAIVCLAFDGSRSLHSDAYAYASAAGEVLDGKSLYGEVWQDKPPLGLLAYTLPQLVGRGSPVALGVFLGLVLALQAALVLRVLRDHRPAAIAAALVLVLDPASRADFAWLSTDHVANVGAVALLLVGWEIYRDRAWTRRQLVLAGAVAAACFLVRQTSLVFAAVPAIAIATCPAAWRARLVALSVLGAASAGALVALIALCLPVIDLTDCLYTVFVYPMRYADTSISLATLVQHEFLDQKTAYAPIVLLLIATASPRWKPVVVVAVVSLAASLLPHKPYFHYLEGALPLVAFTVFVACEMTQLAARIAGWAFVGWLTVVVGARTISHVVEPVESRHAELDEVVGAVRELARADDTAMFAIAGGEAAYLTFAAHVPTASPYSICYQIDGYVGRIMPWSRDRVVAELRAHPPTIIVLYPSERARERACPLLATEIAHRPPYRRERVVGDFEIYRR